MRNAAYSLEEADDRLDAAMKVVQVELLVWGVEVVVGEAEAHEDGGNAERADEVSDDGNGTAAADEDGVLAPDVLEGGGGGLDEGVVGRDDDGIAGVDEADVRGDAGRGDLRNEGLEGGEGVGGGHVGDEAEADLGDGAGGDDGLGADAGEAAGHAVDFEGGPGPEALKDGEAGLANEGGGADLGLAVGVFIEGEGAPGGEFGFGGGLDAVVEAGDKDPAVLVFEFGEDVGEGKEGVGGGAAEDAGVKVGAGALDFDFGVDHAAQADAEGGEVGGEHVGVGDEGDVGEKIFGVFADKGGDAFAADLFLALEDDSDVYGELAAVCGEEAGGEEGFKGLEVHPKLALVVDGAAGVEVAVALGGFKGWGEPFVEGLCRLDVVVGVEQDGGAIGAGVEPVGEDERVTDAGGDYARDAVGAGAHLLVGGGFDEAGVVHADALEFGAAELGGGADVGGVGGVGRDGGDAEERLELVDEARGVLLGEVGGVHGGSGVGRRRAGPAAGDAGTRSRGRGVGCRRLRASGDRRG